MAEVYVHQTMLTCELCATPTVGSLGGRVALCPACFVERAALIKVKNAAFACLVQVQTRLMKARRNGRRNLVALEEAVTRASEEYAATCAVLRGCPAEGPPPGPRPA